MESRNSSEIVKAIRTLLTSAKNGLTADEIISDYEQMEGKQIPLNALGYNKLEDLLRDTNQFALVETKQGIKVISKPSKDAYVNKSAPNSPSKGKKKGNMMPPQRALRSTTDNQWNGTAYSQAYTQMPNRSVKKPFTHPAKLLQAAYNNGGAYRPILKQSNIKQVPKDDTLNYTANEATNNSMNQSRPYPMRQQNNQQNSSTSNIWMNQRNMDRITRKSNDTTPSSGVKSSVQSRLAIQKNLSIDVPDYVVSQPAAPEPEETASYGYSNGGAITQKVSEQRNITIFQLLLINFFRFQTDEQH